MVKFCGRAEVLDVDLRVCGGALVAGLRGVDVKISVDYQFLCLAGD